jgi:beta-glucosidase
MARVDGRRFPKDHLWGAATSAYQVEGAVREDGRGESVWDRFSHLPGRIRGGDTGDVACDQYHRYPDDIALMVELGLGAYRFSIAWPRILPEGVGRVNEAGLDHYERLVDGLLGAGIEPFVTLYHWDLPQALEDRGGWPERATAQAFADYAAVVARRLGDRVPHIVTLNEPWVVSHLGYREGVFAPGRRDPQAALAAAHHLLLGHGLAVAAVRAAAPAARVGIALNFEPKHPASGHPLDLEAAAVAHDQYGRWFLDPLSGRDYPAAGAAAWGWRRTEVQDGDMACIAAPLDFMGVNYYTREVVRSPLLPALVPDPTVERTGMGWEVYPDGLLETLEQVASRTGDLPLYITENGAAYPDDPADPTHDPARVHFLRRHARATLTAIERGIPVRGSFVWSLLDNFEWAQGYSERFGIVRVDFATQERRTRDSGRYWAALARTGDPEAAPAPA